MGETGKRPRSRKDYGEDSKSQDSRSQKKKTGNNEDSRGDEMIMYRILCPDNVIGSVIGKSGKVINSIRQETRSKVKVMDPFPGSKERVITIYCYVKDKEDVEVDDEYEQTHPLCPAQDALLKVHAAITNASASGGDSDKKRKDKDEAQLLVPSSQAANIIGKSGATIKKMRSKTRANIRVSPKDNSEPNHSCALSFDNFLQITGDTEAVKQALFAVSTIMYKFSPKEDIPLDTSMSDGPPSIIIPSDMPIYPSAGFYPTTDTILPPQSVSSLMGVSHVPELHGYSDLGSAWPVYSPGLPLVSGFGGSSRSGELDIRVLCPREQIGRVIGKGGSAIKSVRQESGARVEVDDTKGKSEECIINVTSTESVDDMKSMAVEAVLLIQEKINDNDDRDSVNFRLLVPSKVIGCVIGKSGAIINEIRKRTKADVRISKSKKPKCAQDDDELVEVLGEVSSVRDALIQIILRLRDDVLKDRDGDRGDRDLPTVDSIYSGAGGHSIHPALQSLPPAVPLGYDQRVESGSGYGMAHSRSLYGYEPLSVADNSYGSYSSKAYAGMLPPSTLEMVIPANAVGKVMGRGGGNIANIRKISGADIEITDSKSYRGERVAHITGTPEQKREAENLIQAFIMST